jgi:hypothetical protein
MIPACMAETAFFASLLGGSIIPANPIKVNEDSISSTFKVPVTLAFLLWHSQ